MMSAGARSYGPGGSTRTSSTEMSRKIPSALHAAYGLTIASELPCPELPSGVGAPDVTFREGPVPEDLPECAGRGVCFQSAPGRALVKLDGLFRLLVRDGTEVVIDRETEADDDTIRLFLLGTCLGLLLQQRGELVLHASTVARDGRAIALAGGSSVGKTTLAAAMVDRGYDLVGDETCVVTQAADGTPVAVPGAPSLHLWRHALDELGLWREGLRPVRPGVEKFTIPAPGRFAQRAEALTHMYVLDRWNRGEVTVEPLSGFARFQAFLDNTFREPYHEGLGLARRRQTRCAAIAPRVRVHRLTWPHRWTDVDEAIDLIEHEAFPDHGGAVEPASTRGATDDR